MGHRSCHSVLLQKIILLLALLNFGLPASQARGTHDLDSGQLPQRIAVAERPTEEEETLNLWYERFLLSSGLLLQGEDPINKYKVELLVMRDLRVENPRCGRLRIHLLDTSGAIRPFYGESPEFCAEDWVSFLRGNLETVLANKNSVMRAILTSKSRIKVPEGGRPGIATEITLSGERDIQLQVTLQDPTQQRTDHGIFSLASYNVEQMRDPLSTDEEQQNSQYSLQRSNWGDERQVGAIKYVAPSTLKARKITSAAVMMGTPEILALQEIQNERVFKELLWPELFKIGYRSFHLADQRDQGEVPAQKKALLTTAVVSKFPIISSKSLSVRPYFLRQASRNPQVVEIQIGENSTDTLVVYNSHWPSRNSLDALEEDEVSKRFLAKIIKEDMELILLTRPQQDMVLVGDLNSLYNQSFFDRRYLGLPEYTTGIQEGLLSTGDEREMQGIDRAMEGSGRTLKLYNLWYELPLKDRVSSLYQDQGVAIDHILVTPQLYDQRRVQYVDNSFHVMPLQERSMKYLFLNGNGGPLRWQIHSGEGNGDKRFIHTGIGYSDHLPLMAEFRLMGREGHENPSPHFVPSSTQNEIRGPSGWTPALDCEHFTILATDGDWRALGDEEDLNNKCVQLQGPLDVARDKGREERWVMSAGRKVLIQFMGSSKARNLKTAELDFLLAPAQKIIMAKGKLGFNRGILTLFVYQVTDLIRELLPIVADGSREPLPRIIRTCAVQEEAFKLDFAHGVVPAELDLQCLQWGGAFHILSVKKLMHDDRFDLGLLKQQAGFHPPGPWEPQRLQLRVGREEISRFLDTLGLPEEERPSLRRRQGLEILEQLLEGKVFQMEYWGIWEELNGTLYRVNTGFNQQQTGGLLSVQEIRE